MWEQLTKLKDKLKEHISEKIEIRTGFDDHSLYGATKILGQIHHLPIISQHLIQESDSRALDQKREGQVG